VSEALNRLIIRMQEREVLGLQKYGTTMDRTDLGFLEWVVHAHEEVMDLALYLERVRTDLVLAPSWDDEAGGNSE
jgi:hypothetical protein